MNYIKDIKLFNKDELETVNMIIEIEKGSRDKNELVEPNFDRIECVRKCKLKYPFYYGCFPQTLAGDKDPADAILLTKNKYKVLDVVKVQPIAIIKTIDNGEEDNKIICIDSEFKRVDKIIDRTLKFLKIYKGKKANMTIDNRVYDAIEALNSLKEAHRNLPNKSVNTLNIC